jgi:MFS family permease
MNMSVLADVFASLGTMSLPQLLAAFIACFAYGLAQGSLLDRTGRRWAWGLATCAAAVFIVLHREWPYAVMLVAIALAGLGWFTAMVWLASRLVGIDRAQIPESAVAGTAEAAVTAGETDRHAIGATAVLNP